MVLDSYAQIGSVLRQARLDARLTLRDAATRVHIRTHYLNSLEHGAMHELPGLPYVRGFLTAYSQFLNLEKDEMLRRFEQVEGGLRKQHLTLPEVFGTEKSPSNNIIWGALGGAFALYIIWVLAFKPLPAAVDMAVVASVTPEPQKSEKPLDDTCFKDSKGLYPPCYAANKGVDLVSFLLPHRGHVRSVMDLATHIRAPKK